MSVTARCPSTTGAPAICRPTPGHLTSEAGTENFFQKIAKETKNTEIAAAGRLYCFASFVSFCSKIFRIGANLWALGPKPGTNAVQPQWSRTCHPESPVPRGEGSISRSRARKTLRSLSAAPRSSRGFQACHLSVSRPSSRARLRRKSRKFRRSRISARYQ